MSRFTTTTVRSGVAVTMGGQVGKFVLQIGSLAVLSRLLDPTDFGLLAMILAIVGIAAVLGDFGFSMAAVQRKTLSRRQSDNLFWINSGLGLMIALILCITADLVARFYDSSEIANVVRVIALMFVFNGVAVQFRVQLTRALRFSIIAVGEVSAQLVGLLVGIVLALNNAGVWALAGQQLAASGWLMGVFMASAKWLPGRPRLSESMKGFTSYSTATTATQLVNYLSVNIQPLLIGRVLGAGPAGIYNRAFQVFMLPLQQVAAPVTRVVLPHLSRILDTARYSELVLKIHLSFSYALTLVISLIGINAAFVTNLVLGAQWADSAVVLQILAVGGIFQALGYVYYWIFLAEARMLTLFWCELPGRAVILACSWWASSYGIVYVAAVYSAGTVLIWIVTSSFGVQRSRVAAARILVVSIRVILLVTAFGALSLATTTLWDVDPRGWLYPVSTSLCLTAAVLVALSTPWFRRDFASLLSNVRRPPPVRD